MAWALQVLIEVHERSVAHIVEGAGGSFEPKGPVSSREGFVM
jgi:hypothetical protein